jgi:hypothetical protein
VLRLYFPKILIQIALHHHHDLLPPLSP